MHDPMEGKMSRRIEKEEREREPRVDEFERISRHEGENKEDKADEHGSTGQDIRQHRWNLVSDEKVVRLGQRAQGCERNKKKEKKRERREGPNEAKPRPRKKKRYICDSKPGDSPKHPCV